MKKRIKKKLEKENIKIHNFNKEYKKLNKTIESRDYYFELSRKFQKEIIKLTPKEVIISKSMFFALIGYLPKDISEFFNKYKLGKIKTPYSLGTLFINFKFSNSEMNVSKLEEKLQISEINLSEYYVKFLFKGLKIEVKIPINVNELETKINSVEVNTKAWSWDFKHSGIVVLSDSDYGELLYFYKTAFEVSNLMM